MGFIYQKVAKWKYVFKIELLMSRFQLSLGEKNTPTFQVDQK